MDEYKKMDIIKTIRLPSRNPLVCRVYYKHNPIQNDKNNCPRSYKTMDELRNELINTDKKNQELSDIEVTKKYCLSVCKKICDD